MRTFQPSRLARDLTKALSFGGTMIIASAGMAGASNTGPRTDPPWPLDLEMSATSSGSASQQSSASAWAESDGDHGVTVTTTRSGDSTSCMVVEWKRENGVVRKWQYRCDDSQP
jgi:hypothetical protein